MPEVKVDTQTGGKKLPSHAKVVVIGGGVVGCSILFHLAKFGWKDAILLERDELTSGSSWHAAGGIHTISSDPNISRLQSYTTNLYKEIEELSGHSVGLNQTGGFYAASTKDWYDYLKGERSKARYMGLDQEFISPKELAERHPLIDPDYYHAVLWDAQDGHLDPSGTTYAFAKAAKVYGAQYFTHCAATDMTQRPNGSWDVVTPKGTINAEHVVNADRLETAFERLPAMADAGIKDVINGPFTFGPDGNPLIGPVPGMRNYWVAVGVMAGFCQGGGVGLSLAEWMIDGEPSIDVWAMDVARFGEFATPEWGKIKSSENYERRFVMTFPNETLPKGRKQKTTALYDRMIAKGAVMDQGFGLEHVLWFANNADDAHELPTFERNRSHDYVGKEIKVVREAVGGIEIANFAKHEFKGAGCREYLNHLLAGFIPKPGRLTLTPMLTPKGKLYGDLTVACIEEDHFMLFGSGAMQEAHRRWFEQDLPDGISYANVSDDWHGIALSGPKSRELLARITRDDVSADGLKFRDVRQTFVAGVPVILNRISFSGELGYEIYCKPQYLIRLADEIEQAGADLGYRWYGARALLSMRLEKGWGVFTMEYRPDFDAIESGMDAFINWKKGFVGKEATIASREKGVAQKLVVLNIDVDRIDVAHDEAILKNGEAIGYVSSGGYAHHVKASMAMGYVKTEFAEPGSIVQVEILGEFYNATILSEPMYDASGSKMRS